MIWKMGCGMKKGGCFFVGFFWFKFIIGVLVVDVRMFEVMEVIVFMVNVEVECECVNVNVDF